MLTLTPNSFVPSDIMIYLLYDRLSKGLHEEVHERMLYYTREQMRYAFAATLNDIREWRCCQNIFEYEFWIIDRDCNIREEFYREVRGKSDLHKDAEYEKYDFRIRFGEEIMGWFLRQPAEAMRCGLKRADDNHIVLTRNGIKVDATGSA